MLLLHVPAVPLLLLLAVAASAWAGEEDEAYRKVSAARDQARRFPGAEALQTFEKEATRFLDRYPHGRWAGVVWLWRGDALKERDARAALAAYGASGDAAAAQRVRAVLIRFETPPALEVESWLGTPVDPTHPSGEVTLLVFFSISHPQSSKVLGRLAALREKYAGRGLRIVGVAAVVDDHANQKPAAVRAWVEERKPPFPVAIDRQRPGAASVSLDLYQGNQLPWAAFLDRYGRVASLQAFTLQGNPAAQAERELQTLLEQPRHAELVQEVREGGAGAESSLEILASIRTRATADALFQLVQSPLPEATCRRAREQLEGILPLGFLGADLPAAARRWRAERERCRYAFLPDRFVEPGK
ncbi:MAG: TlpA disulfide reductase family protein [Planctomycetaceae bacterium]